MAKFAPDTNVLVDVLRSPDERAEYQAFLQQALPVTFMSAVVGLEVIAGATSADHVETLERDLLGPFQRRGRLFGPTPEACLAVGRVLCLAGRTAPPSRAFLNDLLIAFSCRERGITLLTRNGDFRRIARLVPGLKVRRPYPNLR